MGHRQMYHLSQMPEVSRYQLQNGHYLGTQPHYERVPTSGVNSVSHSNILTRPNEHPPAGFRLDVQNCRGSIAVSANHHLHPLSSGASNQSLRDYAHFSLYNSFPNRHVQMDNARLPCKRRTPDSMVLDQQSSSGYYGVATSSNFPNLSGNLHLPISHGRHWDANGTVYGYRMNRNSDAGQRSVRNVRRRTNNRPEFDICPPVNHSPSIFARRFPPMEIAPDPSMGRQWNITYRSTPPDRSVLSSGNVLTTLSSHGPVQRRGDLSTYEQRATSHTTASNYVPPLGLSITFPDRSSGLDFIANSRFSRPSSSMTVGCIERSAWDMNMYDRHLTLASENYTGRRVERQNLPTMDHLSAYSESEDTFDEHSNMRLDIDNMGYEELLALGERIGNVNTGLSEDSILSFLLEMVYRSSDEDEDVHGESCPICLEEYKDEENQGRLKCGHVFHFCCIKEWLQRQNWCPICKAPAEAYSSK